MSETGNVKESNSETEKPVSGPDIDDVVFPPFPDPDSDDFDDDISSDERDYYKSKFPDLNTIRRHKLHCSACDRHLGCAARNESRLRVHPLLRTLMCQTCHTFYNSGEFDKGDDGSELYCRWCGQGGQVYCCSNCPHVFCARCIKRNMGNGKIKEIENTDDWRCFKCNPKCLWDLRALCWALLRYCDLKNKITYKTEDARLKEEYQKDCGIDYTDCCKNKRSKKDRESIRRREDKEAPKKREERDKKKDLTKKELDLKKELEIKKEATASVIAKIPSTIQVKKFASINSEESNLLPKVDKKAQKRSLSPKLKPINTYIKNTVPIAPYPKVYTSLPSVPKKLRMVSPATITPIRIAGLNERMPIAPNTYGMHRFRQRMPLPTLMPFNGFGSNNFTNYSNDNINLSLDSLTQGLDMSSLDQSDDIVCMPDLPLEPLCEINEDNDDDVQCMTPITASVPKASNIAPKTTLPDISPENIIQMTDNDVTVNATTGGLKFRVDPQTLSSNKMYRLPDGRIFAINANPNMPGGYSATIVAVTENSNKSQPKGTTFAAKLNSVISSNNSVTKTNVSKPRIRCRSANQKTSSTPSTPKPSSTETIVRNCDLNVPVEWYRYNLIDAIDALSYSSLRLQKLKKDATTNHLRTRTVEEMRKLHKALDRLLNNSSVRFMEIKAQLNKEMKKYISKKMGKYVESDVEDDDDYDDDVEILPNNEEPISIDENSLDSITNDSQDIDLTTGISDNNESGEKETSVSFIDEEPALIDKDVEKITENISVHDSSIIEEDENKIENHDNLETSNGGNPIELTNETNEKVADVTHDIKEEESQRIDENDQSDVNENEKDSESDKIAEKDSKSDIIAEKDQDVSENGNVEKMETEDKIDQGSVESDKNETTITIANVTSIKEEDMEKSQDTEMTDELIENLLKDDTCDGNAVSANDVPDLEDA